MEGAKLIQRYTRRWQLLRAFEAVLYGAGVGLCAGLITQSMLWGILLFSGITAIALVVIRPWQLSNEKSSQYIDYHFKTVEYSSSLLLTTPAGLSGLARLQREKVTTLLASEIKRVKPQTGLKKAMLTAGILTLVGILVSVWYTMEISSNTPNETEEQLMVFQTADSVAPAYEAPVLLNQNVTISYPSYTKIPARTSSTMNVKVVEGTRLTWKLGFNQPLHEVRLEGIGEKDVTMTSQKSGEPGKSFTTSIFPKASGYYNFRFADTLRCSVRIRFVYRRSD